MYNEWGACLPKPLNRLKIFGLLNTEGAAEYEFGEVPKSLQQLALFGSSNEYFAGYVEVKGKVCPIREDGYKEWRIRVKRSDLKNTKAKVFVFCHKDHAMGILEWLEQNASDKVDARTRDCTFSDVIIFGSDKKYNNHSTPIGGLALEECPFIYLTYPPSIENFCKLFGVTPAENVLKKVKKKLKDESPKNVVDCDRRVL